MREIKAQTLCREAFRPYGDFMDLLHVKQIEAKPEANNVFAPDLVTLHLDGRMPASACVARVSECERIITALEYHQFTCEGILPLDGDIDIFVGPSSFRVDPATVEAFPRSSGHLCETESRCTAWPSVCGKHPCGQRSGSAARAYLWQRLYLYHAGRRRPYPHPALRRNRFVNHEPAGDPAYSKKQLRLSRVGAGLPCQAPGGPGRPGFRQTGHRQSIPVGKPVRSSPWKKLGSDGLFDYYQYEYHCTDTRLGYYFLLKKGEEELIYTENGFLEPGSVDIDHDRIGFVHFQFPFINGIDVHKKPSWVNSAVFYQIFPERFCNGDPSPRRKLSASGVGSRIG